MIVRDLNVQGEVLLTEPARRRRRPARVPNSDVGEIRNFSRDDRAGRPREFYRSNKLKYYVGDVRD